MRKTFGINNETHLNDFWNEFRVLFQYKYLTVIKKKKYRQRKALYETIIGDEEDGSQKETKDKENC